MIGQLPRAESLELTVMFAALVHASVIVTPNASNAATVVTGAGAALALHPSTEAGVNVPVIVGAVVSWIVIVCCTVLAFRQASFTV